MIIDFTSLISHVSVSNSSAAITSGKFVSITSSGEVGLGLSGSKPFGLAIEDHVPGKRIQVITAGDSPELSLVFIPGQFVYSDVDGNLQSAASSPGAGYRKVGRATAVNRFKLSDLLEDLSVY